jgi:hypothetical protein
MEQNPLLALNQSAVSVSGNFFTQVQTVHGSVVSAASSAKARGIAPV